MLVNQYRRGLEIARRLAARLGRPLATLDFGGGLGVPYFATESAARHGTSSGSSCRRSWPRSRGTAGWRAPGSWSSPAATWSAEAGIYVARVNDIKVSRGKTFYILDGGMNHHLAASGNLGQVIKRNFPLAVVNRLGEPRTARAWTSWARCARRSTRWRGMPRWRRAEVGDLVGIFQSGAYGLSASPLGFLSHPTPAEVLAVDGVGTLIRPRLRWEDLLPS